MVLCLKHKNRKKLQNYTTPIPKKLSKITDKLINPSLIRKLDLLSNLIANWKVILKDDSFWSKPKRLDFYNDEKINGEITISIFNGRGPEAVAKSEDFCKKINEFYGYSVIKKIKITQDLINKNLVTKKTDDLIE